MRLWVAPMANPQALKLAKIQRLQGKFAGKIEARIAALSDHWQGLKCDDNAADRRDFHRMTHSLAGSAASFGFVALGVKARELELLFSPPGDTPIGEQLTALVDELVGDLGRLASAGPDPKHRDPELCFLRSERKPSAPRQPLVYILEDDTEFARETALQLEHFGYRVTCFHQSAGLLDAVKACAPDAMLVDIHMPEGSVSGTQAVSELQQLGASRIPVLFMSGYDSWDDRLNAVRAGGQGYIRKPLSFNELVERLDIISGRRLERQHRILVVENDELLAQHYAAVLQAAGMETEVVTNVSKLLDVLSIFSPDLVLMDIYMPACTGIEASCVIRQYSAYANLPIVYLSTESDLTEQLNALRVGGDDFLQKPIADQHLVTAVQIRASRFRELSALMNRDSLTGLLNHINLKLALEREIAQSSRQQTPLSLAMLDIDHFKSINDKYGHPEGDRVIKTLARLLSHRVRQTDVAARYGGEEFAVIFPITSSFDAAKVIEEIQRRFADIPFSHEMGSYNATFSAGVATCPPHVDVARLIVAADQALYQAKKNGRNCTVVSAATSG